MPINNVEVRRARAFLRKRGVPSRVMSPRKFAEAAEQTGKSFSQLLRMTARLMMGGQGQGQAKEARQIATQKQLS